MHFGDRRAWGYLLERITRKSGENGPLGRFHANGQQLPAQWTPNREKWTRIGCADCGPTAGLGFGPNLTSIKSIAYPFLRHLASQLAT